MRVCNSEICMNNIVEHNHSDCLNLYEVYSVHTQILMSEITTCTCIHIIIVCCHYCMFNVSRVLALKLDQLIKAAARGRCNDEMTRLWVQCTQGTLFSSSKCELYILHLSQHRTLQSKPTRHPVDLCHMLLTGLLRFCWWRPFNLKMLGLLSEGWTLDLQCCRHKMILHIG